MVFCEACMNFHVITLFPEVIEAYANVSILGRAQKEKKIKVIVHQLRDFAGNKWGKVDERPYGGGPGMVLRAEPVIKAVQKILKTKNPKLKTRIIITSAGGKPLTNAYAKILAKKHQNIIIVCGRYEGIDARAKKVLKADEVSAGPYILTGGELPALAIVDAAARQIPGVLGKFESLEEGRVASHDVYTRPEILKVKGKSYRVPKVLLSGHHAKINALRQKRRSAQK
ncbi:MAG: tRNA (guanine-N(1)-)-methyltransferase [Candidatus Adlerbacteria bacterium GW2011_GWA1_54_10]|uniref:tRNA (guanine-N(1)-)-methyltransferase n=3 Tax=Candidatus Adleribacteriota TaxID=1752736 RepID=A0A0G2A3P3_9BACT|nr:MAG: tRNA (guanine-N(1)-)-methyltransferase [Candidatus Adlerbacteria bacterium GW2011_GWA1_54_10]KKW38072.1 MAG: tRNA (guanine-N(1)-)-methyltransferase [Candidatus Adlerbacteria bacterium GW2011_GWB1_54_7]